MWLMMNFASRETLNRSIGIKEIKGFTAEDITAIEMARKTHFDMALIDVVMPGIDGFQTLDEIKKIDPENKGNNDDRS